MIDRQAIVEASKRINLPAQKTEKKKPLSERIKEAKDRFETSYANSAKNYATEINSYFQGFADEYTKAVDSLNKGDTSAVKSMVEKGKGLLSKSEQYKPYFDNETFAQTTKSLSDIVASLDKAESTIKYIQKYNELLDRVSSETIASGWGEDYADFSAYQKEAESLIPLVESIGDKETAEAIKSGLNQIVDYSKNLQDYTKQAKDFYSQFQSEDEYNKYLASASTDKGEIEGVLETTKAKIAEKEKEIEDYKKNNTWWDRVVDMVFPKLETSTNEKGQKVYKTTVQAGTKQNKLNELKTEVQDLRGTLNIAETSKALLEAKEKVEALPKDTREQLLNFTKTWAGTSKALENIAKGNVTVMGSRLPAETAQKEMESLENSLGKDNLKNYVDYASRIINSENAAERRKSWTEYADKNFVTGTLATIVSAPINVLSYLSEIELIKQSRDDKPADLNAPALAFAQTATDIRGTVGGNIKSPVAKWFYDVGTSVLDSGLNMALGAMTAGAVGATGVAAKYVTAGTLGFLMGNQVAASETITRLERGESEDRAVLGGLLRGSVEAVTEAIGGERFIDALMNDKTLFKKLLKGSIAEGVEEVGANVLNRAVDKIYDNKDAFDESYQKHTKNGLSEAEAFTRATLDLVGEDTLAFLGGALSGLALGGGGVAYQAKFQKNLGTFAVQNNLVEKLLEQAKSVKVSAGSNPGVAEIGDIFMKTAEKLYPNVNPAYAPALLSAKLVSSNATTVGQINNVIAQIQSFPANQEEANKVISELNAAKAKILFQNNEKTDLPFLNILLTINKNSGNTESVLKIANEAIQEYSETGKTVLKGGYSVEAINKKINTIKDVVSKIQKGTYNAQAHEFELRDRIDKAMRGRVAMNGRMIALSLNKSTLTKLSDYIGKDTITDMGAFFATPARLKEFAEADPALAQRVVKELQKKQNPVWMALSPYINASGELKKTLNEMFGIYFEDLQGADASVDLATGKISLSVDLEEGETTSRILGHECFHVASKINPEAVNAVIDFINGRDANFVKDQIAYKSEIYKAKLVETMTAEEADNLIKKDDYLYLKEEIAADFLGRVVARDEGAFVEAIKSSKSILTRALETVNKFLKSDKINAFISETLEQKYERLSKAISKVLKEQYDIDIESGKAIETTKQSTEAVRYSLSDYLTSAKMTSPQIGKQVKEQGLQSILESLAEESGSLVDPDNVGGLYSDVALLRYNGLPQDTGRILLSYEIDGNNSSTIGKLKEVIASLKDYVKDEDSVVKNAASDLIQRLETNAKNIIGKGNEQFVYDMTEVALMLARGDVTKAKSTLADIKQDYLATLKILKQSPETESRLKAIAEMEKSIAKGELTNGLIKANPLMSSVVDAYQRRIATQKRLEEKISEYGALKKGGLTERDVAIPQQINEETKVRRFEKSVIESGIVDEQQASTIAQDVLDGNFNYLVTADKPTLNKALDLLKEKGRDGALFLWRGIVENDTLPKPHHIALAELLIREYNALKDSKTVEELVRTVAIIGTEMGQSVHALYLVKRLSGEGRLQHVERIVKRIQENIDRRANKKIRNSSKIRQNIAEQENLQSQLGELERKVSDAKDKINTLEEAIEIEKQITSLQTKLAEATKNRNSEQKTLDDLVQALYSLRKANKAMGVELDTLNEKIAQQENKLATAVSEYNSAVEKLETAKKRRQELTDKIKKILAKTKSAIRGEYQEWWKSALILEEIEKGKRELKVAQKNLDNATLIKKRLRDIASYLKKKGIVTIDIPQDLKEKLRNPDLTQKEIGDVFEEIYKVVGEQVPPTKMDIWNNWRYFAMLFNVRTHVRNFFGNAFFMPAVLLKDAYAYAIESGYAKTKQKKGEEFERTKAYKGKKKYKDFAEKDFETMKESITGGGKFNPSGAIENFRKIFKPAWLEALRTWNFKVLELEDALFLSFYYKNALKSYLAANNADIDSLTEGSEMLEKARAYAVREAQKNTYRDKSEIANSLQRLSKQNAVWNFVVEGAVPFKKTPINILARGIEYSPVLGAIKAFVDASKMSAEGKRFEARELINGLASSFSGTTIFALGYLFRQLGLLKGSDDEDDEKSLFDKLVGGQTYAWVFAAGSYTIGWMAPISIPLFAGAALYDLIEDDPDIQGRDDQPVITSLFNALGSITEPMESLSMLSGLTRAFSATKYTETTGEWLASFFGELGGSYLSQATPSMLAAVTRTIDPKSRRSYTDKTNWMPDIMQQFLQTQFRKIPGLNYLLEPYVDEWGNTDQDPLFERIAENFVSPGYYEEIEMSSVEKELDRLFNETKDGSIFPDRAPRYIKFTPLKGTKQITLNLTAKKYTEFATKRGKTFYSVLENLTRSKYYKDLREDEKVKVIQQAKTYAYTTVTESLLKKEMYAYEVADWITATQALSADDKTNYLIYKSLVAIGNDRGYKERDVRQDILDRMEFSDAVWLATLGKEEAKLYQQTVNVRGEDRSLQEMGVPIEIFIDVIDYYSMTHSDYDARGKETVSKKSKVIKYIDQQKLTPKQKFALYMTWYDSTKGIPGTWWNWK